MGRTRPVWGGNTGVPACQARPCTLTWCPVSGGVRHGGGGQRMRAHDHMWQRGCAFQLSESIWHGCHHWQRRETQSSFHRTQAAPSPGPEAELGTVGSRHVLAGWQSRWGSPLPEVLQEAGRSS